MKKFLVLCSWFLVPCAWCLACSVLVHATATGQEPSTKNKQPGTEVFRLEAGKFPPLEMAHSCRGELVFVDHANRRGSNTEERFPTPAIFPKY